MFRWMILPKRVKDDRLKYLAETDHYRLYSDIGQDNFFLSESKGLFLFGYILPVLSNTDKNVTPKNLLNKYEELGEEFIKNYKGIFTLIIYNKSRFLVINDRFGISKFFYIDTSHIFASNNLKLLSLYHNRILSKINILEYFVFNYFVNGNTMFKSVFNSLGGTIFSFDKMPKKRFYFDIADFLKRDAIVQVNRNKVISESADLWNAIIRQYLEYFSSKNISLTLTAGLDSRMILAAMKKNGYLPFSFTFGHDDSMDVVGAKRIANKLKLNYSHLYPDDSFFKNFFQEAVQTLSDGDSLTTLYRAHRRNVYGQIKEKTQAVFFGFIGSEIIRGLYPDGLLISGLIQAFWLDENLDVKGVIEEYLKKYCIDISKQDLVDLTERIKEYDFVKYPDHLLFGNIIPLHFGQDIRLLEKMGVSSLCPYWDIDFLMFLKNTPFFISNSRQKDFAKLGHFRRRKQPLFSSKIITMLDPDCADVSLGKWYSPKEYANSQLYSYFKLVLFKLYQKMNGRYGPNFSYSNWFIEFLKIGFEKGDLDFLNMSRGRIDDMIEKVSLPANEFSLLHLTQLLNVGLLRKLI